MIHITTFGYHHGQSDNRLYIKGDDGEIAAYLDFSVFEGQPSIQMIRSTVPRQGLARSLVLHLQSLYPDVEIDWGMLTGEGAALKKSLTFRTMTDPVMKAKADLLARVKEKLAHLEANATPELVQKMSELWNRLYDMERRLEDELEHAVIDRHIIIG
jgi:hypothetical protein